MEIVHALSRGVDRRKIFLDDHDRYRFVHDLFEFNDQNPLSNTSYRFLHKKSNLSSSQDDKLPRKLLVDIYAFCLMPNHFHLLLSPKVEGGVSKFMKKLDMGYARYFNERHKRQGTLFESRYKSVLVKNTSHFIHLPYYIHLNPLDLVAPEWRGRELKDRKKATQFLNSYRWSSHLDYLGKKNFPSVTQRAFLSELLGEPREYKRSIKSWLRDLDLETVRDCSLE